MLFPPPLSPSDVRVLGYFIKASVGRGGSCCLCVHRGVHLRPHGRQTGPPPVTSCFPGFRLSRAYLHVPTRPATSVCQPRHDRMEQGPTEPHAGRGTFLLSSGGVGGAGITEWPLVRGRFRLRTRFPGRRQWHVWSRLQRCTKKSLRERHACGPMWSGGGVPDFAYFIIQLLPLSHQRTLGYSWPSDSDRDTPGRGWGVQPQSAPPLSATEPCHDATHSQRSGVTRSVAPVDAPGPVCPQQHPPRTSTAGPLPWALPQTA